MNATAHAHRAASKAAKPIRIHTAPRMHVDMTADAVRLQAALLAKLSKPRSPEFYIVPLCVLLGLAVFVMGHAGWLPGAGA